MSNILKRLFSRPQSQTPVRPEWAQFLTDEQYGYFASLVTSYFRNSGLEFQFDGSFVTVTDGRREPRRLGLLNLAQKCASRDKDTWGSFVKEHFDRSAAAERDMDSLRSRISDFSAVQDLLAVQLYSPEGCLPDAIVSREDLPGLLTVLVLDLPGATQQASRVDAAGWGKTWTELFEIGIQNVFKKYKPKNNNLVKLGEVTSVVVFEGDEFYTATFSLMLNKLKDLPGPTGALMSVPKGGVLLCHAIGSGNPNAACELMSILSDKAYALGPYSLSNQIYWFFDGRFRTVQSTGKRKDETIVGPPELLDAIASPSFESNPDKA